jgi:uncharacterized protein YndB with AHSA1/START domain
MSVHQYKGGNMADVNVTKDEKGKKLIVEFSVEAPKQAVWEAYTDKELFEKWWGPEGWETQTKEFDFQPNGRIHYGMKCVDEAQVEWYGQTSWGVMEITQINPSDEFTYVDYFSNEAGDLDNSMPALKVTNQFTEVDGKTKVVSTIYADSMEQIDQLLEMGMVEGFTSQLRKLDKLFV